VLLIMFKCDGDDDNCSQLRSTFGEASQEYQNCLRARGSGSSGFRTGGGSFGGYSGGGSHK
jgi:hypothetical protein